MGHHTDRFLTRLGGMSIGDLLIGLATVALILALLYPTVRSRSFRALVQEAATEVETLRIAAIRVFEQRGSWPTPSEPGGVPPELAGALAAADSSVRASYTLQWSVLEVVGHAMAPRTIAAVPADADAAPDSVGPALMPVVRGVGSIVVYSAETRLLAELLARYGTEVSFVRDTTWTLVVPQPGGGA